MDAGRRCAEVVVMRAAVHCTGGVSGRIYSDNAIDLPPLLPCHPREIPYIILVQSLAPQLAFHSTDKLIFGLLCHSQEGREEIGFSPHPLLHASLTDDAPLHPLPLRVSHVVIRSSRLSHLQRERTFLSLRQVI